MLSASGCALSRVKPHSNVLCHCNNICWSIVGSTGIVDDSAKEAIKLGRITPELILGQGTQQNFDNRMALLHESAIS